MKSIFHSLGSLAIISVPFFVFGLVWFVSRMVFDFSEFTSNISAFTALGLFLLSCHLWCVSSSLKDNEVVGSLDHIFFGRIEQMKDSWMARMSIPSVGSEMEICCYEGNVPTNVQERTVDWINRSISSITSDVKDVLKSEYSLPDDIELEYESLTLEADEYKSFMLIFEIAGVQSLCGYSVTYSLGVFDQLEEIH